MPTYRVVFPPRQSYVKTGKSVEYDSGDQMLKVGSVVEVNGERWRVTQVPLEEPLLGEVLDILVWPDE
jgi:hypothetical protein